MNKKHKNHFSLCIYRWYPLADSNKEKEINQLRKSNNHSKTLGPVESLEQYLTSDWWKHIFNSMYLKTDADVVEDPQITETEVTIFHKILNIKDGNTILDLACGQGRHLIELANRGSYNLFGLDRSRYLIPRARRISKKKGLSITFKEGDIRKLPYPADSFARVTNLVNSFRYFGTLDDDIKMLEEIFRVLKPGGKVLLDIADGSYGREKFTQRSWEWIDDKYFVCRECSLAE